MSNANPIQPPGYLEGVNVPRLILALHRLGCATEGLEATAAALADHVNRLTQTVMNVQFPQPTPRAQEPAKTCTWRVGDDELMIWESACGETWSFSEGGPAENNVRYCVRCGKPVRVEGDES